MEGSPATAPSESLDLLYICGNLYIMAAVEGEVRMLREVHKDDQPAGEMLQQLEGESEEEEDDGGPTGVRILRESDCAYSEISQESGGNVELLQKVEEYGQISLTSNGEMFSSQLSADDDNSAGEMFPELEQEDLEGEVTFLQEVDDDSRSGSASRQKPKLSGEETRPYILYTVEKSLAANERMSSQYFDSLQETGVFIDGRAGRRTVALARRPVLLGQAAPTVPAVCQSTVAGEEVVGEGEEEQEEVLYVCGRCGQEMPSLPACRRHMLLEHCLLARDAVTDDDGTPTLSNATSSNVVRTPLCGAEYWLQPRTPREVRSKLCSDRNIRCTVRKCTFRFSCESSMEQHRACHTVSVPVNSKQLPHPYTCPHCSAGYPAWPACSLHLAREHGLALDLLACPLCQTHTTHSVGMMVRHLSTHGKAECRRCTPERPQGQRWYTCKKCQICSKMYANSKSLKKHIQAVHHKLKPFKCNVCGHSSATKNMLQLHTRQHTGEKPYLCEFCPYRTGDLNTRNKHRMRHTGEFPYRCPHCPYRTIQSGSLGSHLRHHHPHLPTPPCPRHPAVQAVAATTPRG